MRLCGDCTGNFEIYHYTGLGEDKNPNISSNFAGFISKLFECYKAVRSAIAVGSADRCNCTQAVRKYKKPIIQAMFQNYRSSAAIFGAGQLRKCHLYGL